MSRTRRTQMEILECAVFARRLNELMVRAGMSQSDVARALWGSRTNMRGTEEAKGRDRISNYVRGAQMPNARTLRGLADIFGVEVTDLHPGFGMMSEPPALAGAVAGTRGPREPAVMLSMVGGRPDLALLQVDRVLPLSVAVKIMELLASVPDEA